MIRESERRTSKAEPERDEEKRKQNMHVREID